jgi:hypothetical protein
MTHTTSYIDPHTAQSTGSNASEPVVRPKHPPAVLLSGLKQLHLGPEGVILMGVPSSMTIYWETRVWSPADTEWNALAHSGPIPAGDKYAKVAAFTRCTVQHSNSPTVILGYTFCSDSEAMFDWDRARRESLSRAIHGYERAERIEILRAYEQAFGRRERKG